LLHELDQAQNGLGLDGDSNLRLIVERSLNDARIEVNEHADGRSSDHGNRMPRFWRETHNDPAITGAGHAAVGPKRLIFRFAMQQPNAPALRPR
jgi:hypothetical protein